MPKMGRAMICAHPDSCLQVCGGFSGSASLRGKQQSRADAERRTLSQSSRSFWSAISKGAANRPGEAPPENKRGFRYGCPYAWCASGDQLSSSSRDSL
jgi:hypothetical protein